jgi:hypothetical protein
VRAAGLGQGRIIERSAKRALLHSRWCINHMLTPSLCIFHS